MNIICKDQNAGKKENTGKCIGGSYCSNRRSSPWQLATGNSQSFVPDMLTPLHVFSVLIQPNPFWIDMPHPLVHTLIHIQPCPGDQPCGWGCGTPSAFTCISEAFWTAAWSFVTTWPGAIDIIRTLCFINWTIYIPAILAFDLSISQLISVHIWW